MDIARELGNRIRYYRKGKKITQEKLAEICNLHPTYIGQLERGEKNATIETVYRIAIGLEVPLSQLLENIKSPENSFADISSEICQLCLSLPPGKQKQLEKVLREIVGLLT